MSKTNFSEIPLHSFQESDCWPPISLSQLDMKCHGLKVESPHRHTFYEIIVITSGSGLHMIDFIPYEIKPPVTFFVSPGQIHFWQLSEFIEGYALVFDEEFLSHPLTGYANVDEIGFFYTVGQSPEIKLNVSRLTKIEGLMQLIKEETRSDGINKSSVLSSYLNIVIVELQRIFASQFIDHNTNDNSWVVRKYKRLIAKRFKVVRSVEAYAKEMNISVSGLNRILKSMTGLNPSQMIRNEIIMEAKRLLVHTNQTVSEIGYELRFEDPSYFARFFKRETHTSPSSFRQDIREKYQLL